MRARRALSRAVPPALCCAVEPSKSIGRTSALLALIRISRAAAAAAAARRHVILPKHVSKNAPKGRLLSESEWRGLGVQQSRGWVHYAIHR